VKRFLYPYGDTVGRLACESCARQRKHVELGLVSRLPDGSFALFLPDVANAKLLREQFERGPRGAWRCFSLASAEDFPTFGQCRKHGRREVTHKTAIAGVGTADTPVTRFV
jgi:hypothetical protein